MSLFEDKFVKPWNDFWDTILGRNEERHSTKADELAQQAQDFNEKYSTDSLAEQERQFEKTFAQSQSNIDWQKEMAEKNYAMQQDVYQAQMRENELTRQREDSAYQRQVADLKAAGLSPLMASNGAGATSLSVGTTPQYDTQAVSTAQGSAIELAREYAELRNMARGQYLTRKQEATNQRIGAQLALSQLDKERRLGFQNLVLDGINLATNISRARMSNEYTRQQTEYSKALLNWERDEGNGFRNQDPWNTLVPVFKSIASDLGVTTESVTKILSKGLENVEDIYSQIENIVNPKQGYKNEIISSNKNTADILEKLTPKEIQVLSTYAKLPKWLSQYRLNENSPILQKYSKSIFGALPENRRTGRASSPESLAKWILDEGWSIVLGVTLGL